MADTTALRLLPNGSLAGQGTDLAPPSLPQVSAAVARETTQFVPPRTRWTSATRIYFPDLGPGYRDFQNEILLAASADRPAIVTRYVQQWRSEHENATATDIAAHRARLQAFVTTYEANWP